METRLNGIRSLGLGLEKAGSFTFDTRATMEFDSEWSIIALISEATFHYYTT